tara:strand:+ start:5997 stop:6770 length:774 start_codon:yes stop_codon:yes gene_type:complete
MLKKIYLIKKSKSKKKLVCLTAYSKPISKILDKHCDIILVGDSVATAFYGMKNTREINLETMLNHGKSVKRSLKKSLLVFDMPHNTYRKILEAKKNAKKIIKTIKCDAVKIESNGRNYNIIKSLVKSGIPVMGHIGFTPQFKKSFKIQGQKNKDEKKLIQEAKMIEKAGAFSIVLECIKKRTAERITKTIKIPTIGIGSSSFCDGQILVTDDLLGLSGFYPRFVKKYANLENIIESAVRKFKKDVKNKKFPTNYNAY